MFIVECTGIKSLLLKVTIETVFLVEIGGVTTVQVMQTARRARFRFWDDNQVNVLCEARHYVELTGSSVCFCRLLW